MGDAPIKDKHADFFLQNGSLIIKHAKDYIISLARLSVPLNTIPVQPQIPETHNEAFVIHVVDEHGKNTDLI